MGRGNFNHGVWAAHGNTSVLFEPKISVVSFSLSVMAAVLMDVCMCFSMCSGTLCLERSRPNTTS